MTDQEKSKKWPWVLVGISVAIIIVGGFLFFTLDKEEPRSWQDEFNHQNGTAVLIDISDDHPRHLIKFDFDLAADGNVATYSSIVCWGEFDDYRMQTDEWAIFSNEIRKYYGVKFDVTETAEKVNGTPLSAMKLTVIPYKPLTPQQAQDSARKVSKMLWDFGPCKMS